MNTVISKLLVYIYSGYNKDVYYEMSVYILSHLSIIEFMTVSEFAQNCHTSLATIKKFCQILGYKDFNVMKKYLFSTMDNRKNQIRERYLSFNEEQIFKEIECISQTKIDKKQWMASIEQIVDDMHKAEMIGIIGANYPLFLAFNFIEDMLVFDKKCFIQNVDRQIGKYFENCHTYGLLITITGRYFMLNQAKSQIMQDAHAQFGIISQNISTKDKIKNVNSFIQLPGNDDSESLNLIILNILINYKFIYYRKYVIK